MDEDLMFNKKQDFRLIITFSEEEMKLFFKEERNHNKIREILLEMLKNNSIPLKE